MSTTITETATLKAKAPTINTSPVTANNLGTVRKLNSVLFPVKYTEPFYKTILQPELEEFCKLIYFNDIPVGTTCSRIERGTNASEAKLYMMTMGVLAPYRNWSAGSYALKEVVRAAKASGSGATPAPAQQTTGKPAAASTPAPPPPKITHIYLHVQVSNPDARRFYERHGFKVVDEIEAYYKKIEPRGAWVLELDTSSEDVAASMA